MISAFKSTELASYLGYIRSRMRIARALCFNSFFLTIATALFVGRQTATPVGIIIGAVGLGLALTAAAFFAWWRISLTFYKRLSQARDILCRNAETAKLFEVDGTVRS